MISTFVFMGRPGSGKGTQAKRLSESLGYVYYGTGEAFRSAKTEATPVARLISQTVDKGYLMPHWFASYIVTGKLIETQAAQGLVIDGSNRTLPEAELFYEQMEWLERDYRVIYLDVDEATIIDRLRTRGADSNRDDDMIEKIHTRVKEYDSKTAAARAFIEAKDKMLHVDGNQSPEVVEEDIKKLIAQL